MNSSRFTEKSFYRKGCGKTLLPNVLYDAGISSNTLLFLGGGDDGSHVLSIDCGSKILFNRRFHSLRNLNVVAALHCYFCVLLLKSDKDSFWGIFRCKLFCTG